jgi:hypothetical protein
LRSSIDIVVLRGSTLASPSIFPTNHKLQRVNVVKGI